MRSKKLKRMYDIRGLISEIEFGKRHGYDVSAKKRELDKTLCFIEGIDDALVRAALKLFFIEGRSWANTAFHIGGCSCSAESVKKAVYRYFEKNESDEK